MADARKAAEAGAESEVGIEETAKADTGEEQEAEKSERAGEDAVTEVSAAAVEDESQTTEAGDDSEVDIEEKAKADTDN